MMFFITVRLGEVVRSKTTNQTNQPVHCLHCSPVRLVRSVWSDRIKEQAYAVRYVLVALQLTGQINKQRYIPKGYMFNVDAVQLVSKLLKHV